jgi:hypothetical protein
MENINKKLIKYRTKLINATDADKVELYNLKMQQYMIMQKNLLKKGGNSDIFAVAKDTKDKLNSGQNVYSIQTVEDLLTDIKNKVETASEGYQSMKADNQTLTKEMIDLHREVSKSIEPKDVNQSPVVQTLSEALKLFEPVQNILVEYYQKEISELNEENKDKIPLIVQELGMFEKATRDLLKEKIADIPNVPEEITKILNSE